LDRIYGAIDSEDESTRDTPKDLSHRAQLAKLSEEEEKEYIYIAGETGETVDRVKSLTLNEYLIRLSVIKDKIEAQKKSTIPDGD
jgi:hypothetical protein